MDGFGAPVDYSIELAGTDHLTRRPLQFRHPVLTLLWCLRDMPLIAVSGSSQARDCERGKSGEALVYEREV